MHRKPCAEIESEFDVWFWKVHSIHYLFHPRDEILTV